MAAKAVMSDDGELRIDASSLPALTDNQYYEVNLTDSARTKFAAVGRLDARGLGTFTTSVNETKSYMAIEVSVQNRHAPVSTYSGVSVLRGIYG